MYYLRRQPLLLTSKVESSPQTAGNLSDSSHLGQHSAIDMVPHQLAIVSVCHDELMKQTEPALPQRMISMGWLSINVRGGEPLPRRRGVDSEGTASGSLKHFVTATCFRRLVCRLL